MFRGEVWQMSLGVKNRADDHRSRQVVILSSDALGALPIKVIVPLTLWKEEYSSAPWMVRLPPVLNSGLDTVMGADAMQVRSITSSRLVKHLGELPNTFVEDIARAISLILEGTLH